MAFESPCKHFFIGFLMVCAYNVSEVTAQTPQLVFDVEPAIDSVAIKAAAELADTGRMAPAYKDLSRYSTPGYCLAGMLRHSTQIWRRGERDTLPAQSPADTLPVEALETGRECLGNLEIADVPIAQIYSMIRLALLVNDIEKADTALHQWMAALPEDPRERGYAVFDAVHAALSNFPPRLTIAERWMEHFDSLGHGAFEPQIKALSSLFRFAQMQFDTTAMIRINLVRHSLVEKLTSEELKQVPVTKGTVFNDSLNILWYKLGPDELYDAVKRVGAKWANVYDSSKFSIMLSELGTYQASIPGAPLKEFPIYTQFPDQSQVLYTLDRVTLFVKTRLGNGRLDSQLATLRRLHEKYGSQRLDIVLVLNTAGFAWSSPPLSTADEAKIIGWYFRDHLKLPFKVVVEETQFTTRSDDRRIGNRPIFVGMYDPIFLRGVIIGKDGNISSINYGFASEAMLEAYVVRELNKKL